ncbi:putative membrane protein YkoI [Evansella vedderi]|uniref:Membrane protein YkoI n=1 Tax=Evansella vedderi TaxID=38282 RepID=A0ABT9ZWV1_9BACI|nr:PepSY domain-containing protein [Evansella vedderi]MDQ0255705.1 putative membrane protein YkoI [Evansella vedderi]
MKNKTWIAVLVSSIIIAAFGLGFSQIFANPENDPLSTQEISEIISERYPGEIDNLELTYEQGAMIYLATVLTDKGSYEIKVDARTGTILEVRSGDGHLAEEETSDGKKETIKESTEEKSSATSDDVKQKASYESESKTSTSAEGHSATINESQEASDSKESTGGKKSKSSSKNSNDSSETSNESSGTSEGSSNSSKYIGIEAAKQVALSKVNGVIIEIELESDDGIVYYEIEMKTDQGEATLEINAITGDVISFSMDSKSKTGINLSIDTSLLIGVVEAKRIAQEQVSGTIKEIELDSSNGRLIYEIEMKTSKGEAEIEIDAYTGKIISIEMDD